jgi:hypothetical protein
MLTDVRYVLERESAASFSDGCSIYDTVLENLGGCSSGFLQWYCYGGGKLGFIE